MLIGVCMFNIFNGGGDMILAISIFICFAQSATVLAMALRAKNKEFRDLALPTVISGIFGVTEPALFGTLLKYRRTMLGMFIGGAIGAVASGIMGVTYYMAGGSSNFMVFTNYLQGGTQNVIMAVAGMAIAFVIATIVVYLTGFTKEEIEGEAA